jgi:hypothetical protein
LISSVNDDADEYQLGNRLAQTLANMYGGLAGLSNDHVADLFPNKRRVGEKWPTTNRAGSS